MKHVSEMLEMMHRFTNQERTITIMGNKFPLTERLGLQILRETTEPWYTVSAADLERVLESAPVVEGDSPDFSWFLEKKRNIHCKERTHTARLICIEEIKEDTAEDLLRQIIKEYDEQQFTPGLYDRARKLLSES